MSKTILFIVGTLNIGGVETYVKRFIVNKIL